MFNIHDIQPDPVWVTKTIIPLRECVYGNEKFLFHGFFEEERIVKAPRPLLEWIGTKRIVFAILEDMDGNLHRKEGWQNIRFLKEGEK